MSPTICVYTVMTFLYMYSHSIIIVFINAIFINFYVLMMSKKHYKDNYVNTVRFSLNVQ